MLHHRFRKEKEKWLKSFGSQTPILCTFSFFFKERLNIKNLQTLYSFYFVVFYVFNKGPKSFNITKVFTDTVFISLLKSPQKGVSQKIKRKRKKDFLTKY